MEGFWRRAFGRGLLEQRAFGKGLFLEGFWTKGIFFGGLLDLEGFWIEGFFWRAFGRGHIFGGQLEVHQCFLATRGVCT